MSGSTAGVVRQGGQQVFASSTAPARSSAPAPAKSRAKAPVQQPSVPATSTRSATGDLWSGVTSSGAKPSLASAAATGGKDSGLSGAAIAGMAILGLGLVGIGGGAVVATRRRRATGSAGAKR